jgi:hypothetical protein
VLDLRRRRRRARRALIRVSRASPHRRPDHDDAGGGRGETRVHPYSGVRLFVMARNSHTRRHAPMMATMIE